MSIGAVLAQLRGEFPDVTISKIRFLESEGLVQPARSPSGYRQFTAADVERLRYVLSAQRDHYLPLKVIREQLEAAGRGGQPRVSSPGVSPHHSNGGASGHDVFPGTLVPLDGPEAPCESDTAAGPDGAGHHRGLPSARDFAASPSVRLTREELLSNADVDAAMLAEIERYGLIRPGPAGFYDTDDAAVAGTVKTMTNFGIEPRHLRAFRASADREVGLLEQILAPVYRHRDSGASARADEMARELAALSVTLHTLLVKSGVRGVTGG